LPFSLPRKIPCRCQGGTLHLIVRAAITGTTSSAHKSSLIIWSKYFISYTSSGVEFAGKAKKENSQFQAKAEAKISQD